MLCQCQSYENTPQPIRIIDHQMTNKNRRSDIVVSNRKDMYVSTMETERSEKRKTNDKVHKRNYYKGSLWKQAKEH